MFRYINEHGKECFAGASDDTPFDEDDFHLVAERHEDDIQFALHTNLGSLTVLDRRTGFGWRDTETGYRDPNGQFWLASGGLDVRESGAKTLREAIDWVKKNANNCVGE